MKSDRKRRIQGNLNLYDQLFEMTIIERRLIGREEKMGHKLGYAMIGKRSKVLKGGQERDRFELCGQVIPATKADGGGRGGGAFAFWWRIWWLPRQWNMPFGN